MAIIVSVGECVLADPEVSQNITTSNTTTSSLPKSTNTTDALKKILTPGSIHRSPGSASSPTTVRPSSRIKGAPSNLKKNFSIFLNRLSRSIVHRAKEQGIEVSQLQIQDYFEEKSMKKALSILYITGTSFSVVDPMIRYMLKSSLDSLEAKKFTLQEKLTYLLQRTAANALETFLGSLKAQQAQKPSETRKKLLSILPKTLLALRRSYTTNLNAKALEEAVVAPLSKNIAVTIKETPPAVNDRRKKVLVAVQRLLKYNESAVSLSSKLAKNITTKKVASDTALQKTAEKIGDKQRIQNTKQFSFRIQEAVTLFQQLQRNRQEEAANLKELIKAQKTISGTGKAASEALIRTAREKLRATDSSITKLKTNYQKELSQFQGQHKAYLENVKKESETLKGSIKETKANIQTLEETMKAERETLESRRKTLEGQGEEGAEALRSLTASYREKQNTLKRLEESLKSLEAQSQEKITALKMALSLATVTGDQLQTQTKDALLQMGALKQSLTASKTAHNALKGDINDALKTRETLKAEKIRLETQWNTLTGVQRKTIAVSMRALKKKQEENTKTLTFLQGEEGRVLETIKEQGETLKQFSKNLLQGKKAMEERLLELNTMNKDLQTNVTLFSKTVAEKKKALEKKTQQLKSLSNEADVAKVQDEIKGLKQALAGDMKKLETMKVDLLEQQKEIESQKTELPKLISQMNSSIKSASSLTSDLSKVSKDAESLTTNLKKSLLDGGKKKKELEDAVNTTTLEIEELKETLGQLKQKTGGVVGKNGDIAKKIAEVEIALKQKTEALDGLRREFQNLEALMRDSNESLKQDIAEIGNRNTAMQQQKDALETEAKKATEAFTSLKDEVGKNNTAIQEQKKRLEEEAGRTTASLGALKASQGELQKRITEENLKLEGIVGDASAESKREAEAIRKKIESLKAQYAENVRSIADLQTKMGQNQRELQTLVTESTQKITQFKEAQQKVTVEITSLTSEVDKVKGELEGKLATLKTNNGRLSDEQIAELKREITTLQETLKVEQQALMEKKKTFSDNQAALTGLEEEVKRLTEQLTAQKESLTSASEGAITAETTLKTATAGAKESADALGAAKTNADAQARTLQESNTAAATTLEQQKAKIEEAKKLNKTTTELNATLVHQKEELEAVQKALLEAQETSKNKAQALTKTAQEINVEELRKQKQELSSNLEKTKQAIEEISKSGEFKNLQAQVGTAKETLKNAADIERQIKQVVEEKVTAAVQKKIDSLNLTANVDLIAAIKNSVLSDAALKNEIGKAVSEEIAKVEAGLNGFFEKFKIMFDDYTTRVTKIINKTSTGSGNSNRIRMSSKASRSPSPVPISSAMSGKGSVGSKITAATLGSSTSRATRVMESGGDSFGSKKPRQPNPTPGMTKKAGPTQTNTDLPLSNLTAIRPDQS